ncbi:hypothetical protein B1748_01645 [Paenibacillus sp. MY03]|jgi:hypothetical protein|uniref:Uncharacterized protein n=2 Tax=Paenibacillus TaxID=44249 RepID=A0A2R5EXV6_9BACL|nr:hypothetical protein B1748_01645 [Paenibacillus sp. MY03]GBG09888.1 hypothetical protein PAT3040_04562 [Paenibacillus agaridevorans]
MLMTNGQKIGNHGPEPKRRYKSGQRVQFEGIYHDEWGGSLLLLPGDVFPLHPHMGHTCWTYKRTYAPSARLEKASNRSGRHTAARRAGFLD